MQGRWLANTTGRRHPDTEMTDGYIELKFSCPRRSVRYIRSVLIQGNTLGLLAATMLKGAGRIFAFAPLESGAGSLPPLTEGALHQSFKSSTAAALRSGIDWSAALASEIEQHLARGSENIVIFADSLASPGDKWLEGTVASRLRVASSGRELYYILLAEDIGSDRIVDTLSCVPEPVICLFSESKVRRLV